MLPLPSPLLTVRASVAVPVWTTVSSPSTASASTGWAGFTMRQKFPNAALTDVTGSQVRFTMRSPAGQGISVSKMYVGFAGAGTYDFTAVPTQVLFGGSAAGSVLAGGNDLLSDGAVLAYTGTADLMVSVFFAASPASSVSTYNLASGQNGFKSGDDAITTIATGYSNSAFTGAFRLVEALV